MAQRDSYHHGRLREDLIDQAETLIAESGPHGWSMREAARRLGVSQTAPYRHFAGKDALIDAVALRGYVKLEQRYVETLARCPAGQDRLRTIAMAYYRFAVADPQLFSLMFSSDRLHETDEARHSYGVFESEVVAAQRRGLLPAGSARDYAHALWAASHGVAELVNRGVFGTAHGERVAELTIESTVGGLVARRPTHR